MRIYTEAEIWDEMPDYLMLRNGLIEYYGRRIPASQMALVRIMLFAHGPFIDEAELERYIQHLIDQKEIEVIQC